MKCSYCLTENAPNSAFCMNCGRPLARACPNCSQPVTPGAKFCPNCGYPLASSTAPAPAERLATLQRAAPSAIRNQVLSSRGQIEGERKLVTVLFTDIVDSTALAESLDPEIWGEIVSGAHQRVSEAVYRYEGTIAQLLGDGVLAFFGAPLGHEDDAERAIRAGLDILTAIDKYAADLHANRLVDDFQMRVGLNSGLVVVGNIGSDLHMEYLAVGDTVNLAARMQSAADANTILVSENTHRLASRLFDYEDRGRIAVKGKAEPVRVYRVLGERASGAVRTRGIEGLDSPLVGREAEMQVLRNGVDNLLKGDGRVVSIIGEAGLGKSRLTAELKKSVLHQSLPITWLEGRSLSFETSTPYAPFIDLFTQYFGLRGEVSDATRYPKIAARVAQVAPDQVKAIAPFVSTLLGIKPLGSDQELVQYLDPPSLRSRTFSAVREFFGRKADQTPLILVFEDLHWVDSTSLDLIQQLMTLTDQKRMMIIALLRPVKQEPSWRFHEEATRDFPARYTSITLEPLDEMNARQLVANLLEIEDLPEKVRALILRKAEGNPFFVEEVIRSLLDARLVVRSDGHWRAVRDIETIALPDTLVGVIAARLDRLDEPTKHTAQAAAVVGREFQEMVLEDISEEPQAIDPAIVTLERRELIREKSDRKERTYMFKHALTQETAYETILMSKRRELHRRVAECLERRAPDRVNDIAHHFLQAQEMARALPYVVQAGENAARAYSTPEAIGLFTRAIEIMQHVADRELARRAYEGLGSALLLTFDIPRAVAHYDAMLAYGRENEDMPLQISALNKLGMVAGQYQGNFESAEQHLLEAERLAREFEHKPGLAELYTVRCGICTMKGDFGNAARYLTESATIGRQLGLKEQEAFGETHTANTLTYMAEFEQAFAKAQDALRVSEEIDNQMHIAEVKLFPIAFYYLHLGDLDEARHSAEEGVQIAHRIGTAFLESLGLRLLVEIAHLRGEYDSAFQLLKRSEAAANASGLPFQAASIPATMGAIYLEISDQLKDKTLELHMQALKAMENPMAASGASSAYSDLGFCALAIGNLGTAREMFDGGLSHPTILGLLEKPRYLIGLAQLALAQNRLDDAMQRIREARSYVDDHAMAYVEPFLDWADAQVNAVRGDSARALERFEHAEERALAMRMRPMVWQARAGAAQLLTGMGRLAEADAKRTAARAMIDEMAGLFADTQMRGLFVANATKKVIGGDN